LLTPHPMLLVSTDDESDRALQETAEVTGSLDLVDSAGYLFFVARPGPGQGVG
jgi:hypothetical protein